MGRGSWLGGALAAAALPMAIAGCATDAAPARAGAPVEEAPPTAPTAEAPPAPPVAEDLSLEAELRARQRTLANQAWACWSGLGCDGERPAAPRAAAAAALATVPTTARERRVRQALAAEAVDEATLAPGPVAPPISVDDATFAVDDLWAVWVRAPVEVRPRILAAASRAGPPLAFLEARQRADAVAAALGVDRATLVAAQAGEEAASLRRLADALLDEPVREAPAVADLPPALTAELEGVAGPLALVGPLVDVAARGDAASELGAPLAACFLVDPPHEIRVSAPPASSAAGVVAARQARATAKAARLTPEGELVDQLFVRAVGLLARDRTPHVDARSAWRAALARHWRLRRAAARALAWSLPDADASALDALGARVVGAPATPGAAALLQLDGVAAGDEVVLEVAALALAALFDRELGPGWETREESRSQADALLAQAFASWRERGWRGWLERAEVAGEGELVRRELDRWAPVGAERAELGR